MEERTGEAYEGDERLTVVGRKLQKGDHAPTFTLDHAESMESAVRSVSLAASAGTVRLLNVVNSLYTPVCRVETRHWERLSGELPPEVQILTVSMDLPWAQAAWQAAENVRHTMLSSHRSEQFGTDYGVLLKEWRLLQRSVFVIDRQDRIVYAEYVDDQMQEPDYSTALNAARQAATA